MTRPVVFEPFGEGWVVLSERLLALGVAVTQAQAKALAREVVLDAIRRGHVIALPDHRRAIAHAVEVATRLLRDRLARAAS